MEELARFLETEVIPRYAAFDKAHREDHARTVIARALDLAARYPVDADMVRTAAACHDLGLACGRERHHLESGRIIREMKELRRWFSEEQIETIAQAAEDHRASAEQEPRSIYGRIVAEADRLIVPEQIVRRTIQYGLAHYPELPREEQWNRTLEHLHEKYAEGGYLRLWIPESPNAEALSRLRALIRDEKTLRPLFEEIYRTETLHRVAIIGAGAAGCFCALQLARLRPDLSIHIYEAGAKPLAKVAITGGGRCNLSNTFADVNDLSRVYPRGHRLMGRLFHVFGPQQTARWWEEEGVPLTEEGEGCLFPRSQDAMQIVRTLLRGCRDAGVQIHCKARVSAITPLPEGGFRLSLANGSADADAVVVTTGGSPKAPGLQWLEALGLPTVPPVPSLFSFRLAEKDLRQRMGIVLDRVRVELDGTPFRAEGTLLITDWGVSGPAVLRLSSYAARHLAEVKGKGTIRIAWLPDADAAEAGRMLRALSDANGRKQVGSVHPPQLPARVWELLLERSGIDPRTRWAELSARSLAALSQTLTGDPYTLLGPCPFREEFVTCGGVALNGVKSATLEAKKIPGLYFAGEILDIDAVTGGFNLQAAWTTGYTVAQALARGR